MSDEQTRLLQQILEVEREHLAFAKQQREEFMAMQQTALAGQRKSLRMSRFVIWVMILSIGLVVGLAILSTSTDDAKDPHGRVPTREVHEN